MVTRGDSIRIAEEQDRSALCEQLDDMKASIGFIHIFDRKLYTLLASCLLLRQLNADPGL